MTALKALTTTEINEVSTLAQAVNALDDPDKLGTDIAEPEALLEMMEEWCSPELTALEDFIGDLSTEARAELEALIYVGVLKDASRFDDLLADAETDKEAAVTIITGKCMALPQHLAAGMRLLDIR